jgi:hypothetical protein
MFFILALLMSERAKLPLLEIDKQQTEITIQADFIRYFGLGFKRLVADTVWIHSLLESDVTHYSGKELRSWLYLRFLSISLLDAKFYENYLFGSQYLMVIKNDVPGAEDILKRGLEVYPEDFQLNWRMGYLQAIEKGDPKASFPYYHRVRHHRGRPFIFDSIYAKVVTQTLGSDESFLIIKSQWQDLQDGDPLKERLQLQLYSLKAKKDLSCLNDKKGACDKLDFEGNPYYMANGVWVSQKPLTPTVLKIKKPTN